MIGVVLAVAAVVLVAALRLMEGPVDLDFIKDKLAAAADVPGKSIVWLYRSIYAPTLYPDQALIYRWDIGRWSHAFIAAQWIERIPQLAATGSITIAQQLTPGQLQLGAIDPSGRLAYFSGPPSASTTASAACRPPE